jgi:hypothetical protein
LLPLLEEYQVERIARPTDKHFPYTPRYQVGDKVYWVNEYGVDIGWVTVTEIEVWVYDDHHSIRYYITPHDAHWFPVGEECLHEQEPRRSPLRAVQSIDLDI